MTLNDNTICPVQEEQKATAGFWYKWLDDAFGKLSGRIPFHIVDTHKVTESSHLPYVVRPLSEFRNLSHVVRGRHMVEFKRRYGLEGLNNGLDVTHTWRPTMTTAWGFPILMDPRLCNIPSAMGLVPPYEENFKEELHGLHYEWYVKARQNDIILVRQAYDLEQARKATTLATLVEAAQIQERATTQDDAVVAVNVNMGFEDMSDDDDVVVDTTPPVDLGPPEVPEIPKDKFLELSAKQYKRYRKACRNLPWASLYPDPKYQVGADGVLWQELLYDVQLRPVWKNLDLLNHDNQFGAFVMMARYSKASVYKLQASSFCERVNSAGKIVFSESNLKMASHKVEQRTMLRMNRRWLVHMRKHYPDCTADLMVLLRASHDSLNPVLLDANDVHPVS